MVARRCRRLPACCNEGELSIPTSLGPDDRRAFDPNYCSRPLNGQKMLEHWLIELIGHASGLSEAQLKQIEKSLPATKALLDLLNKARPVIEQAQNLYAEAEPLIDQAK